MGASDIASVQAAIERMRGTIRVASILAESGRRIDLTGLDAEAATLCCAVGVMPLDAGPQLRPCLESLLEDLAALTAALGPAPPATPADG